MMTLLATALAASTVVVAFDATPAFAGTILEAENAGWGGTCGTEGQAQSTHGTASGATVVFLGSSGCAVTFTAAQQSTVQEVRWYGGGVNGQVCGTFAVTQGGSELARTAQTCSQGGANPDDFKTPAFPANTVQAGSFQIVWYPSTSWHDAHFDWTSIAATGTVRHQAESTAFGGACGSEGQQQTSSTTSSGATVVFLGSSGCGLTFNATSTTTVKQVRWFGGGLNGSVCGTFALVQGGQEIARTPSSCSVGGANPDDFQMPTFPSNQIQAGSFQIVWYPSTWWHDANLDWVETQAGGTPPVSPGNDNFASATTVDLVPYSTTINTANATRQTGEPQPCGLIGGTVWYKLPSPKVWPLVVDTIGSSYDTVLAVYTGSSLTALSLVGCSDNASGLQSRVSFTASATTYYIQVGGYNGATGVAQLNVTQPAGPTNDNFGSAVTISGTPFTTTQSTTNASSEMGEPTCSGGGTSVWYRYTHPSSAPVRRMYANTFGSGFNTTVGVWQGTSLTALTLMGCSNDSRGTTQSQVGWLASPGQTYYLAAAGSGNATGSLTMRLIEGTLLAIGDSVVAGHGLGATPTGYPNNPTTAYAQQVGDALNLRVTNLAITGACAATYGSGASGTPDGCTTSILSNEINNGVPYLPTHVIVGVGANDIEFATCLQGWLANEPEQDECRGAALDAKLAALGTNLRTVLDRINALSNPRPYVTVMGYYNFFADFDHLTQSGSQVCDFFMPAAISRDVSGGMTDHTSEYWRRHYVGPVQHDGYLYAEDVVTKLNTAISGAATAKSALFVNPKQQFVGHDICAGPEIRGGSYNDVWVWGPDWDDKFWSWFFLPASYHSRKMPGDCPFPQPDHGDKQFDKVIDNGIVHYELHFRPNCLAHPTPAGAAQLASLVQPTMPLS